MLALLLQVGVAAGVLSFQNTSQKPESKACRSVGAQSWAKHPQLVWSEDHVHLYLGSRASALESAKPYCYKLEVGCVHVYML